MTPLEKAARAAYEAWISGVEGIEPAWDDLPQDFVDRLMAAQRAALLTLAAFDFKGPHLLPDEAFKARLRAIATENMDV